MSSSAAASASNAQSARAGGYSSLAAQTDAAKYRDKYKTLKKKVRQIEQENDKLHLKTLRIKRNIQRMRLERSILYERLESEVGSNVELLAQKRKAAGISTTAPTTSTKASTGARHASVNGTGADETRALPRASASKSQAAHAYDSSESPEVELEAAAAATGADSLAREQGDASLRRRAIEYSDEDEENASGVVERQSGVGEVADVKMEDEGHAVDKEDVERDSPSKRESTSGSDGKAHNEAQAPQRSGMKITLKRGNHASPNVANGK